eukprot:CAMPEP_0174258630 /NCGR_PEP_ID=MMETSP0439-20130205/7589_1 /TAXON_ID=0 /ORGANISM="Stereomyxa ramosa, Strain Chinc5" /LENGTH=299 /DNA_ID=CAMNT_0015342205 /DNA_START=19 /DNA_END=918 /DNA_ORIENTATION=-
MQVAVLLALFFLVVSVWGQGNNNQTTTVVEVTEDFYNLRGEFYKSGVDIGAQTSLVRLNSGKWVLLDCLVLDKGGFEKLDNLTKNGTLLEAIINVHPYHTVFVPDIVARYPKALLYGTIRHHELYPDLDWQPELTESEAFQKLYSSDFSFSVPSGVYFISDTHFSSVLVYHNASKTLHVDDTYMCVKSAPSLSKEKAQLADGQAEEVSFHKGLLTALQNRSGASEDFRDWANSISSNWADAQNLCAAHLTYLLAVDNDGPSLHDRLVKSLAGVEWILKLHDKLYPPSPSPPSQDLSVAV